MLTNDEEDEKETDERRIRKPTEKGKAYSQERKKTECLAVKRRMSEVLNKLQSLSSSFDNVNYVQQELQNLKILQEEFYIKFLAWFYDLSNEEEKTSTQNWFDEIYSQVTNFMVGMQDFVVIAKTKIEEQLESASEISKVQSNAESKTSRHSSKSSLSARIKQRSKVAEIQAKTALLSQKQALQNAIERISLQEQLAVAQAKEQVYEEIEEEELRHRSVNIESRPSTLPEPRLFTTLPEARPPTLPAPRLFRTLPELRKPTIPEPRLSMQPEPRPSSKIESSMPDTSKPKLSSTPLNPRQSLNVQPSPFVIKPEPSHAFKDDLEPSPADYKPLSVYKDDLEPSSMFKDDREPLGPLPAYKDNLELPRRALPTLEKDPFLQLVEKQTQLTEILAQQHQQSLLPRLHLSKFTNDPLEFNTFIRNFKSQVETRTQSSDARLQYLLQYLEGEAKDLIKGCLHKDPSLGYPQAMDLLKERYGDPYKVSNAYIKKVQDWPILKSGDDSALERLANFLTQCVSAMESLSYLSILDHPQNLQSLVLKLPIYLQDRWRRQVIKLRKPNESLPNFKHLTEFIKSEAKIATDPVFSREVLKRIGRDDSVKSKPSQSRPSSSYRVTSHVTSATSFPSRTKQDQPTPTRNEQDHRPQDCALCNGKHDLDDCKDFLAKTIADRRLFLLEKGLCYACYQTGHRSRGCTAKRQCKVCLGCHPTALHDYNFRQRQSNDNQIPSPWDFKSDHQRQRNDNPVPNPWDFKSDHRRRQNDNVDTTKTQHREIKPSNLSSSRTVYTEVESGENIPVKKDPELMSMPIVPVKLRANNDEVTVYAMLDNCSTGTFVTEETMKSLNVQGTKTKIAIRTMNGTKHLDTEVITGLFVSDVDGKNSIELPKTFTRDDIPATEEEIPRPELARKWQHLKLVADKMPPYIPGVKVGLLIGTNCPKAIEPKDFIAGKDDGPYAVLTFAGWTIVGPLHVSGVRTSTLSCNRILATDTCNKQSPKLHYKIDNNVKEIISPETLNTLLDAEFSETSMTRNNQKKFSIEDRLFLKKIEQGVRHVDGHYEMPLPFRDENVLMPDNKDQVIRKAEFLKKKLLYDEKLSRDYSNFMNDIIEKDYARKVPSHLLTSEPRKTWYIPHHGVYHPHKPDKIRVVFNCSAKFSGVSLNDMLLQGPDLTSSLVGVLTRFRQRPVAFMGDIDSMFHQVRVTEHHRDYLRFLWWTDGEFSREPEEYQMNVHLFGSVSSPSCANFAVKRTADDFQDEVGKETADVLRQNFYVDDCLRSEDTEEAAIERVHDVMKICAKGGFSLSKITSNSRRLLETIPEEKRSKTVKTIDLSHDDLPIERVLGVHWCIESDELGFRIVLKDKPFTRRGILATISSVYDPIGIAAPVLLQGKKILQELCQQKTNWDDDIPDEYKFRWEKWRKELPLLENFKVQRCCKPKNFGTVTEVEIHSFSDASLSGYGQVSYLRQVNEEGTIHCAFLMAKARLAPLKALTVPRLELTAAVLSVRIGMMLESELNHNIDDHTYWTDSTTVLKYLNNSQNRYKVFVANRVQTIRDNTSPSQWRFVDGTANPADDASRGLDAKNFTDQQRWIMGPDFLWKSKEAWPQRPVDVKLSKEDPEVKEVHDCAAVVVNEYKNILERLIHFSQWYKLCKTVARLMKLQSKYRKSDISTNDDLDTTTKTVDVNVVTADNLQRAEIVVLKLVQENAFPDELATLKSMKKEDHNERITLKRTKTEIKKSSSLYRLDPFLDDDELIRVGGRLSKSQELDEDAKHPIILPKQGHITKLIIHHAHQKMAHSGRGITLNELRNRYWIINGNSVVRWFISKCVTCRRLRATLGEQKMADLPQERVTTAPPFTFSAVDYFGPCIIKEGRKELKRYGVLFTCLASRAIHLESANSLETDAFINALRRFIARRGPVKSMRSDQGTNLVGAVNELRESLKKMDHAKVSEYLLRNANADWLIEWKFNPPAASHMGGSWERMIRTVRSILMALVRDYGHALNDEAFRTFLAEAESIVNCRPLTFPVSDPYDVTKPLTPNHLLTMKSKVALPPPGEFQHEDIYLRKQWKRVQYLAEIFWSRWKKEYLNSLQETRLKWNTTRRNFSIGDIVLVMDERTPRNSWPLARIIDVYPDAKGLVRMVKIKTATSTLERPIQKLVLLLEAE